MASASFLFCSCAAKEAKIATIWTDVPSLVSYAELFNASHDDVKVVVVYKKSVASAMPPAKDEEGPDLVLGSWLKNSGTRRYFSTLDYVLSEQKISRSSFYKQLIDYGEINEKQYLLPVSFNLPAIIYSKKNEDLVSSVSTHVINLSQLKTLAAGFNVQNADGTYAAMGYAPSWDEDFLYELTKLYGADYHEKGNNFAWDSKSLQLAISDVKEWTLARNTDTTSEQNFEFKYLYMPKYRQVTTGRCLFTYLPSDDFFKLSETQSTALTFRWLEQDNKICVEDDIVTLGLYKKAKNAKTAEKFIGWFFNENTQRELIMRMENIKLDTVNFGIANGFSSLKGVNEKYFPMHYRQLLGNLPSEEYLSMPKILPYRWVNIKERVLLPYLKESSDTSATTSVASLEERITDWTKQFY